MSDDFTFTRWHCFSASSKQGVSVGHIGRRLRCALSLQQFSRALLIFSQTNNVAFCFSKMHSPDARGQRGIRLHHALLLLAACLSTPFWAVILLWVNASRRSVKPSPCGTFTPLTDRNDPPRRERQNTCRYQHQPSPTPLPPLPHPTTINSQPPFSFQLMQFQIRCVWRYQGARPRLLSLTWERSLWLPLPFVTSQVAGFPEWSFSAD